MFRDKFELCPNVMDVLRETISANSPCKKCLKAGDDGRENCKTMMPKFGIEPRRSRTANEAKMLEYSTVFGLCKDKPIRVYSSIRELIDEENI